MQAAVGFDVGQDERLCGIKAGPPTMAKGHEHVEKETPLWRDVEGKFFDELVRLRALCRQQVLAAGCAVFAWCVQAIEAPRRLAQAAAER